MAHPQIFRRPFDLEDLLQTRQVLQISFNAERVITVDCHNESHLPVVMDNGQWFTLESPDLDNGFTMRDVFTALGYQNQQMFLTYPEDQNLHNYLDTHIQDAPLSQMSFYYPDVQPPNAHYEGPLPQIAGEPIPLPDAHPELLLPDGNPEFPHHPPGADAVAGPDAEPAQSPLSDEPDAFYA